MVTQNATIDYLFQTVSTMPSDKSQDTLLQPQKPAGKLVSLSGNSMKEVEKESALSASTPSSTFLVSSMDTNTTTSELLHPEAAGLDALRPFTRSDSPYAREIVDEQDPSSYDGLYGSIPTQLKNGTTMLKVSAKKTQRRMVRLKAEAGQLLWESKHAGMRAQLYTIMI